MISLRAPVRMERRKDGGTGRNRTMRFAAARCVSPRIYGAWLKYGPLGSFVANALRTDVLFAFAGLFFPDGIFGSRKNAEEIVNTTCRYSFIFFIVLSRQVVILIGPLLLSLVYYYY